MIVKIYTLIDPITCKIRYIGRTKNSLNTRLIGHISKSKNNKTNKDCWISSLLKQGLIPKIKLIKLVEGWKESHKYEQSLINKAINNGFNLVNSDDRGEGSVNKILTIDQKIKISNTLKYIINKKDMSFLNKKVYLNKDNTYLEFESYKSAAKFLNVSSPTIRRYIQSGLIYNNYIITNARIKQGELLENPITVCEDNQQPSLTSNSFEGSTTNSQIQTDNAEDSNGNKSTLQSKFKTIILEDGNKVSYIPMFNGLFN